MYCSCSLGPMPPLFLFFGLHSVYGSGRVVQNWRWKDSFILSCEWCQSLFFQSEACSFGWGPPPLSVDIDIMHMMKWTGHSPCIFAYSMWSKTEAGEGLGMTCREFGCVSVNVCDVTIIVYIVNSTWHSQKPQWQIATTCTLQPMLTYKFMQLVIVNGAWYVKLISWYSVYKQSMWIVH